MAKTLAQIRSDFYVLIDETEGSSHVSTAQATEFANKGIRQIANERHFPRKFDTDGIQAVLDDADYDCPSNFNFLVRAFFGDPSIANDKTKIDVIPFESITQIDPLWLDRTSGSQGRPERLIMIDRNTFILHPRPNAEESASGKKIWLYYSYYPTALSSDSETPDIPDAYHDAIPRWMAYLAYSGSLANDEKAKTEKRNFYEEINSVGPYAEMQAQELMRFSWGFIEE